MSVVLETALYAFLETLFSNVFTSLINGLQDSFQKTPLEIEKCRVIVRDLRLVLGDAEKNRASDHKIEGWLQDLEDVAYDLEDALEEIDCDVNHEKRARRSPGFLDLLGIMKRLHDIEERKEKLNLLSGNAIFPMQKATRCLSGPLSGKSKLYGREKEKKEIIDFLTTNSKEQEQVPILPILGAGGVGKTALVQHVYNEDKVVNSFELRVWVCITPDWDLCKILKCMIESIPNLACDSQNPEVMQPKVHGALKMKKFLIVLDDIWNIDPISWEPLRALFLGGALGSRVLVTTQKDDVANLVNVDKCVRLSCLSESHWWELFSSYVGFDAQTNSKPRLVESAKEISEKCSRLPLAAVVVGSLLRGKKDEEWRAVFNNNSQEGAQFRIDSVLKKSYDDLPQDLKSCFTYCTLFPKGCNIKEDDVVRLWIAAGLLKGVNEKDGRRYFTDLVSRCLLTPIENYHVMHDLIRDMGRNLVHSKCYRRDHIVDPWKNTRHLSISKSIISEVMTRLKERNEKIWPLRSLLALGGDYNIDEFDDNFFLKLKKLRVLHATSLPIMRLPSTIYQLKLLKYLNLSSCKALMEVSPNIGSLCSLCYLNLSGCQALSELPQGIKNLDNLCHLDLSACGNLKMLPKGIGCLLKLFHLDLSNCYRLRALPEDIVSLRNLTHLNLSCCKNLREVAPGTGRISLMDLLKSIRNPNELHHLGLSECCGLSELPKEIESLANLYHLNLSKCYRPRGLPPEIGRLTNLFHLDLSGCYGLQSLPQEIGRLGNLHFLDLSGCRGLPELPQEIGRLRNLNCLDLSGCNCLLELPQDIKTLCNLFRLNLSGCSSLTMLPLEIGNLGELHHLNLSECSDLGKLPREIGKLVNLQYLHLSKCWTLRELPKEIGSLNSLRELDLSNCYGLEALPEEIKSLQNLHLNVSGCKSLKDVTLRG